MTFLANIVSMRFAKHSEIDSICCSCLRIAALHRGMYWKDVRSRGVEIDEVDIWPSFQEFS